MNKNILALALACGLVIGGNPALAAEEINTTNEITTSEIPGPESMAETEVNTEEETSQEEVQKLIDELNESTENIYGLEEEDSSLQEFKAKNIEATYKLDGVEKTIPTIQIIKAENDQPLANVINVKEFADSLRDTNLKFNVKMDAGDTAFFRDQNYDGTKAIRLTDDDLAKAAIREYKGEIFIDDKLVPIEGYAINEDLYLKGSTLSQVLGYRFRNNPQNSNELLIDSAKSDITVPTPAELDAEIQKADYTILFNWGPWCPWSRH